MVTGVCPGLAAVSRVHRASDFAGGINFIRTARALRHTHHARLKRALASHWHAWVRQFHPCGTAIIGTIYVNRCAARINPIRVAIDSKKAPDLLVRIREVCLLERSARIRAAPHAIGGASIDNARVIRMHIDRMGRMIPKHMAPLAAFRRAPEYTDCARRIRPTDIPSHARKNKCFSHDWLHSKIA